MTEDDSMERLEPEEREDWRGSKAQSEPRPVTGGSGKSLSWRGLAVNHGPATLDQV